MTVDLSIGAYISAYKSWADREPVPPPGYEHPVDAMPRRAAWEDWYQQGERAGLTKGIAAGGYAEWVAKWDPSQPRSAIGQWTAGSGETTTSGETAADRRERERRERTDAAGARDQSSRERDGRRSSSAADSAALAGVRDRISGIRAPRDRGAANEAVDAIRDQLKIPTGNKLKKLPPARRRAAARIVSATRELAHLERRKKHAEARQAAIERELAGKDLGPQTKAGLLRMKDRAKQVLADIGAQVNETRQDLTAARRVWSAG